MSAAMLRCGDEATEFRGECCRGREQMLVVTRERVRCTADSATTYLSVMSSNIPSAVIHREANLFYNVDFDHFSSKHYCITNVYQRMCCFL